MLSKSTTTKIRDSDLGVSTPSTSISLASLGSTRTETTIGETDLFPRKVSFCECLPTCSLVILRSDPERGIGRPWRILLFFLFLRRAVLFCRCSAVTLATEGAGIMAPGAGETSNWNTSVHMPELNIGPVIGK